MNLAEALIPMLPGSRGDRGVIVFVGAGGKTSALFHLARELVERGWSVLVTTTTHLADPRATAGPTAAILWRPEMESPCAPGPGPAAVPAPEPGSGPGVTLLVCREADAPGKVKGIDPSWIPGLKTAWDFVLVEADGSKRLPVKAPESYEPVIPPGTDLVVGVIGLDCLDRPMDGRTVHRPERFSAVTGCAPGAPVAWEHLAALVRHPDGLFKGARSPRAVFLNKSDLAPVLPSQGQLDQLPAELVLVGSLEEAP